LHLGSDIWRKFSSQKCQRIFRPLSLRLLIAGHLDSQRLQKLSASKLITLRL
jgi:hypothetical protein